MSAPGVSMSQTVHQRGHINFQSESGHKGDKEGRFDGFSPKVPRDRGRNPNGQQKHQWNVKPIVITASSYII